MKYSQLMALAEASTGFIGGSISDEFPSMSLTECAGRLPVVILESQISLNRDLAAQNDAMVEATINALQIGDTSSLDSLVEGAFESIKTHIKNFFEKLRKFVKSIIDKLGVQINKMRMTGKQMLARYKNSEMLNHSFDDLVVNGYKFAKTDLFANADTYTGEPFSLLKKGVPDAMAPEDFKNLAKAAHKKGFDKNEDSVSMKKLEENMERMNDSSAEDRKLEFAKAMTNGVDMSSDSWQEDLRKELYGDGKVDLTYGTDFNLDSVKKDLEGVELDKIKSSYTKLLNALNKDEKRLNDAADEFKTEQKDMKEQGSDLPKVIDMANKYFSAFLGMYQDCTSVITSIQSIRVNYETAKVKQAKNIFARMLTYKKKSDTNDASDIEGIDEFDVLV